MQNEKKIISSGERTAQRTPPPITLERTNQDVHTQTNRGRQPRQEKTNLKEIK